MLFGTSHTLSRWRSSPSQTSCARSALQFSTAGHKMCYVLKHLQRGFYFALLSVCTHNEWIFIRFYTGVLFFCYNCRLNLNSVPVGELKRSLIYNILNRIMINFVWLLWLTDNFVPYNLYLWLRQKETSLWCHTVQSSFFATCWATSCWLPLNERSR